MKKTSGSSSITLSIVLPLIPLFLTLLFFEWVISKNWIPAYLIPAPTEVLSSLYQNSGKLWRAAAETGLCALAGFSLSLFVGILLGALLSSSQIAQKIFYPYAVFFQTVPIISIAPLLVIWFGYGTPTTIAASFIVSVFPVMANTLSSILSTDPRLIDLFQLYQSSAWQKFWKLKLPNALPGILTGARIASGLAVIGAIVGEFIGGGGLGSIVEEARLQQRIDRMFAAVLLASLLGLLFFAGIRMLSYFLLRHWHASEKS